MKSKNDHEQTKRHNYAILIVDDVPKNIQLVAKFLTGEGYELFFAQNGEAALKQVNNRKFDLILLDVMMPEMDGFEVCERIKASESTKDIPVIFLTAKTDENAIGRGFSLGGVDYITKPFNPVELTARVRTHLKLRQRERELSDLNATKDTLLSVISHDLKTPFFNIMGLGEILLSQYESLSDEDVKEFITNIVDSSRVSHSLLDNLLNWTRIQTGKIKHSPEIIDLKELVEDILRFVRQQAINKEVECTEELHDETQVYADSNMVQTILRNLVTNAIKYTPRGGKIVLKVAGDREKVNIEVSDTGVGLSEERRKSLFTSGTISSTPGTDNEPGTGFGLILTHEFVNLNKGTIEVESELGKGTTFRVSLPGVEKAKT
ncbi:MAG: hybrid sensor histidine kinase/response regulator [Bacteroidales bacterium]|nr:hybrid sensor histidine kinase/response regulator [Bacteroidales bacterium]